MSDLVTNDNFDLIVMGAGLAGLLIAVEARKLGMSVLVLEAGLVEDSASAGLVGALAPHMPEDWNEKKQYQFQSMQMADEFWSEVEHGTRLNTGYRRLGRLQAIHDEKGIEKAKMREEAAKDSWQGKASWIVDERKHPFRTLSRFVIYDDLSAQIYPRRAMKALEAYAQNLGVKIKEKTRIWRYRSGLVDADQSYSCGAFLIAGGHGAWPFLRPALGVDFGEGTKGQAATLLLEKDWEFPMITGDGFYIVPHAPNLLGIGSTSERFWHHENVDEALELLLARVEDQVHLPKFCVKERWAGIRPRAYRPDPLVGEIDQGVFVHAGGFKTGYSFGNKLAHDLVRMISGEEVNFPKNFDVKNRLHS